MQHLPRICQKSYIPNNSDYKGLLVVIAIPICHSHNETGPPDRKIGLRFSENDLVFLPPMWFWGLWLGEQKSLVYLWSKSRFRQSQKRSHRITICFLITHLHCEISVGPLGTIPYYHIWAIGSSENLLIPALFSDGYAPFMIFHGKNDDQLPQRSHHDHDQHRLPSSKKNPCRLWKFGAWVPDDSQEIWFSSNILFVTFISVSRFLTP